MRNSTFTKSLNQISKWVFLIFIFTIPLYSTVSIKLLLVALVLVIILNYRNPRLTNFTLKAWDVIVYLLILIYGITYSEDWKTGLSVLETSFSLIALSFVYLHFDFSGKWNTKNTFYSFMGGLVIACLICLINATIMYVRLGDTQVFFFYDLTEIINSHPTYLAYYLIASITYGLYLLYNEVKNPILYVAIIFFFIMLMLTGGRTAYISLLLIFSFFILKYLLEEKNNEKRSTFILVIVLFVALFGVNSINLVSNELAIQNDYWERSILWESAIKANPNPLLGVGTGDYKTALNEYYKAHGMDSFARESYNSHNQFIQIYFSNGLIGLMAILILICRPILLSVISQNTLGVLLMFPFLIYGVTEVFLGRYQGVVFFTLLHQVVINQHYYSKATFTLKTP